MEQTGNAQRTGILAHNSKESEKVDRAVSRIFHPQGEMFFAYVSASIGLGSFFVKKGVKSDINA